MPHRCWQRGFWQQAYTNLVRWIVELHRLLPGGWVTLRDVYRCTVDAKLFANKLGEAKAEALRRCPMRAVIAAKDLNDHKKALGDWGWDMAPGAGTVACRFDAERGAKLEKLKVEYACAAT